MLKEAIFLVAFAPFNPNIEPEILWDYTDHGGMAECERTAEKLNHGEIGIDQYVTDPVRYTCDRGFISATVEWEKFND